MAPEHELKIGNPNSDATATYRIEVNGVIEQQDTGEKGDSGGGGWVEGRVTGGWDTHLFRGTITLFELDGGAQVEIEGQSVSRKEAIGYDTRDGFSSSSGGEDESVVDKISDAVTGDESAGGGSGGGGGGQDTLVCSSDYGVLENERASLGGVGRPYSTDGDIELHVGRGRAYETLQAAFNEIPHHVNHEVRIFVHGRTRDRNSAHIHNVQMANDVDFVVDGSDGGVVNDGGVNVHIAGKLDHVQFDSLKFEHISQCINARFEDCDFNGNGTAAFSGKEGSKMLVNCSVGSSNDDYGIFSIGGEIVEVRGGELNGQTACVRGNSASTHVLNNVDENAPETMAGGSDKVFVGGERVD